MKIIITRKKLIFIVLFAFFVMFIFSGNIFATDEEASFKLTSTVNNVYNRVSNMYTYKIEQAENNPRGALKEPTQVEVKFENVSPDSLGIATATSDIDFSKTTFVTTRIL